MHKCINQKTVNETEKLLKGNGKPGVLSEVSSLKKNLAILNVKHNFSYALSAAIIVMLSRLLYVISKLPTN
jgi:hypothetical protein